MSGYTDNPSGICVSPVHIDIHIHVISPAARATSAIVSSVAARESSAVPAVANAAAVPRVSVVWLVHLDSQHAIMLYIAEDLINSKADGLYVRMRLQMRPQ